MLQVFFFFLFKIVTITLIVQRSMFGHMKKKQLLVLLCKYTLHACHGIIKRIVAPPANVEPLK